MDAQYGRLDTCKERIERATHEELIKLALGILMDLEATDSASDAETVRREVYSNFDTYLK